MRRRKKTFAARLRNDVKSDVKNSPEYVFAPVFLRERFFDIKDKAVEKRGVYSGKAISYIVWKGIDGVRMLH